MVETLGPNMARSIVGDVYDPSYVYELETTEQGMFLIVSNPADGTSTSRKLEEEIQEERPHYEPLFTQRELSKDKRNSAANIFMWVIFASAIVLSIALLWR